MQRLSHLCHVMLAVKWAEPWHNKLCEFYIVDDQTANYIIVWVESNNMEWVASHLVTEPTCFRGILKCYKD